MIRPIETYRQWLDLRGVHHAHCEYKCEHPQPFIDDTGGLICGACWFIDGVRTEMIPCTPETCGG